MFFGLLSLALLVRLAATQYARFGGDEAVLWESAHRLARGEALPAFGMAITGSAARHPGAGAQYLLALPLLFGDSPFWDSALVALLHVLAGAGVIGVALSAGGRRAGFAVALLFAFAPWDVLYADRGWNSNLAPIFSTGLLIAAALARSRPGWLPLGLFCALALPQFHLSAPIAWVAAGVLLALRPPRRLPWRGLAIALGCALLVYAPAILSELSTGFQNSRLILSRAGGSLDGSARAWLPVQIFGYGLGFSSSEISYQLSTGFWGGYDDVRHFGSWRGLSQIWRRYGVLGGSLTAVSVALAFCAWGAQILAMLRESRAALVTHRRLRASAAISWAVLAGLAAASLLMVGARKQFFPHYINLLMPAALLPPGFAIGRWLTRPGLRYGVVLALGLSLTSMAYNTARFYLEVDQRYALRHSLSMLARVEKERGPVALHFSGLIDNRGVWQRLARVLYGHPLELSHRAPVRYRVSAQSDTSLPPPAGATRHGPLLLTRSPPTGRRSTSVRLDWRSLKVQARYPDGRLRDCAPIPDKLGCAYGEQPWQQLRPEAARIGGYLEPVFSAHPISGGEVRVQIPVTPGARAGVLRYGLWDASARSANQSPVQVQLSQGDRVLLRGRSTNRSGLSERRFTLTSTRALELSVRVEQDGQRSFGFDLRFDP